MGELLSSVETDAVMIISPHGKKEGPKIGLWVAPELKVNFEEFGDFSSKIDIANDLAVAETIRSSLLESESLKAINGPVMNFGFGVPAFLLLKDKKDVKAISINSSSATAKEHFEIGAIIGKALEKEKKNIGIVASCDLSHRLTKSSPAGFSPKGQKFDLRVIDLIHEKRIEDLLNIDDKLVEEAKPCGLKPIMMLFGILYGAGADWEMSSSTYESPFGVGYLTALLPTK